MGLAGGAGDQGLIYNSGEVRKPFNEKDPKKNHYDQLLSVGRLVRRGAKFEWSASECKITLPSGKVIKAWVATDCPYVHDDDVLVLRNFSREDADTLASFSALSVPSFDPVPAQLQVVIDNFCDVVDFSQFGTTELFELWDDSEHKPRTFLANLADASRPAAGETVFNEFKPVDRKALLVRLQKAGPILVNQSASPANMQKAPKRRSVPTSDRLHAPPAGYQTMVHCDLHKVGLQSADKQTAMWVFAIHVLKPNSSTCFKPLILQVSVKDGTQDSLLEAFGEVQSLINLRRFFLKIEREGSAGLARAKSGQSLFTKEIALAGGTTGTAIPFRFPLRFNFIASSKIFTLSEP